MQQDLVYITYANSIRLPYSRQTLVSGSCSSWSMHHKEVPHPASESSAICNKIRNRGNSPNLICSCHIQDSSRILASYPWSVTQQLLPQMTSEMPTMCNRIQPIRVFGDRAGIIKSNASPVPLGTTSWAPALPFNSEWEDSGMQQNYEVSVSSGSCSSASSYDQAQRLCQASIDSFLR